MTSQPTQPVRRRLSARTLIPIAFNLHPNIKSSFQALKAEEARYDFFIASNDSLTPRLRSTNTLEQARRTDRSLGERIGSKEREHTIELAVEKQFFDTTEMEVAAGLRNATRGGDFGNQPFVSARVRYPLGESREKLERSSEDIFRQNELNDTQLDYIQVVRRRLQRALESFHRVITVGQRVAAGRSWKKDLEILLARLDTIEDRDTSSDRRRIEAELTSISAEVRNLAGLHEIDLTRLKSATGLPYETVLELDTEPFNPFVGQSHDELLRASIETDPEIATLNNALRNAEVQLDLARRGKWDVALLLDASSDLRGRGAERGNTRWSLGAGLDISAVDPRVTDSLIRQARSSIARFREAIAARQRDIYVDTLQPLIRIETLSTSRAELVANLRRFEQDYEAGLSEFFAGNLNIDDLLKRRETLFEQQEQIARIGDDIGENVAELCSATGKFFELINAKIE